MVKKSFIISGLFAATVLGTFTGCTVSPPRGAPSFLERSRRIRSQEIDWNVRHTIGGDRIDSLPQPEGKWVAEDDAFIAVQGEQHRALLLWTDPGGPVRIAFTAVLIPDTEENLIGDITLLFGAGAGSNFFNSGYSFTTGSFWNHCTTLYRAGEALARTEWSPLMPNRAYEVVVERVEGHFRYWLNGEILLEAWDPDPLPVPEDRWIGIRTWNTRLKVKDVVLYRPY